MCWLKQEETLDEYLLKLRHLSEVCNYKAVSSEILSTSEWKHTSIGKETQAIVEALKYNSRGISVHAFGFS